MNNRKELDNSKNYWLNETSDFSSVVDLPIDYARTPQYQYMPDKVFISINKELQNNLQIFSSKQSIHIHDVMLAAQVIWQYLNTYEEKLSVGIPVHNEEAEITFIPITVSLENIRSIKDLVQTLKEKVSLGKQHSIYPFTSFVSQIYKDRDPSRPIGFSSIFSLNETPYDSTGIISYETDIIWNMMLEPDNLEIIFEYNMNVFSKESMYRFGEQITKILSHIATCNISEDFRNIDILTALETSLYNKINVTKESYPKNKTIVDMFYDCANYYSNKVALASAEGQLSYNDLNQRSNRVANRLLASGLQKGDFVAIFMERSLETVISLLGILKAGGVYVPIDPSYPKERCQYLLQDSNASFILSKRNYNDFLSKLITEDMNVHEVLNIEEFIMSYNADDIHVDLSPNDLAYVIYTSGSTGNPKGTLIAHEGVINLTVSLQEVYGCNETDTYIQFASYSFDASVGETFMALFFGSKLYLISDEERKSIEDFADMLERESVTGIFLIPTAFFNQIALYLPEASYSKFATVQKIGVGGEALVASVVRQWQKRFGLKIDLINLYGPTECTVITTYHKITEAVSNELTTVPIGKPLTNYECLVLSPQGNICPVNVAGELCIGGIGLAKGYLNKLDKTAEVFVTHSQKENALLYKSGDIVRLLPNGSIEYIGRKDLQVKVRGFRIEIGEIEDTFSRHQDIQDVAIIAKKLQDGNNILISYYTTVNNVEVSKNELREYVGNKLPSYMVPDILIPLDKMPISPTGKIDRKKLSSFDIEALNSTEYASPENETQEILANAWSKVLGLAKVGIHDDFFYIGGHSLKVLQVLLEVKKDLPILKIQDIFKYRTIKKIDDYVQSVSHSQHTASDKVFGLEVRDLVEPPMLGLPRESLNKLDSVLLTGATGFLGSHLLYELLKRTDAHVYCIVRPSAEKSSAVRLLETFELYFGKTMANDFLTRVTVLEGDFSLQGLGLSEKDKEILGKNIDAILHCGAEVRHFGEVDHFYKTNRDSIKNLLDLAKLKDGIHFHHISTLGVPEDLAESGHWDTFKSTGDFDYSVTLENVYTNSKMQAEVLLREAYESGIPVSIYRAGNLTANSQTGMFQKNMDANAFYRMIKAMLYLGKAPSAKYFVDLTPIEYASGSVVELMKNENNNGHIFHICNPEQIEYEQFVNLFKDLGYNIELLDAGEYENWLLNSDHSEDMKQHLTLAIAQLEGDGAKDSDYRFRCTKTTEFLAESDISCARPDKDFINALVQYAAKQNYFPHARIPVMSE